MVGVAQWLEHQVVALGAAGSIPVTHPIIKDEDEDEDKDEDEDEDEERGL